MQQGIVRVRANLPKRQRCTMNSVIKHMPDFYRFLVFCAVGLSIGFFGSALVATLILIYLAVR
jgi:hypothetical protein